MTDPQAKRILDTIDRVLQKKSAAPPPANDELRGMAEEFTPILKDIALEIIGAKSVVSSNLSDAKPENVLTRRVLPLLAQVAARATITGKLAAIDAIQSRMLLSAQQREIWRAYRDEIERRGAELQKAVS